MGWWELQCKMENIAGKGTKGYYICPEGETPLWNPILAVGSFGWKKQLICHDCKSLGGGVIHRNLQAVVYVRFVSGAYGNMSGSYKRLWIFTSEICKPGPSCDTTRLISKVFQEQRTPALRTTKRLPDVSLRTPTRRDISQQIPARS